MAELVSVRNCDVQTRRGDIIFIHGLNGNPRGYWCHGGQPENFWPSWLGEDLPDVAVWSLGYENAALKSRRLSLLGRPGLRGFAMPLMDRAKDVLNCLERKQIGLRPLVFITHSMGGLLVKQLLRKANESTDSRQRAILEQTRGVCFIATPHIGSDLAKWVLYFRILLGTNVALDELRPHEPLLRDLKEWYSNFVTQAGVAIKTLSFYEMKPFPGLGKLVVEPGDADPGVPHAGLHPLDEDHNSICKPTSKRSLVHTTTLDFIRACLGSDATMESPGGSSLPEIQGGVAGKRSSRAGTACGIVHASTLAVDHTPMAVPARYDYDVFISYSSRNRHWVRGELLERIENAGLRACIDFRDFTRGAPSIKEMERAVLRCCKTLVVLTPEYLESGWAEIENIMVQTLDPANRDLRLIPLLKAECEKPLRIGALTHIDFTDDADLELAWRQLLTALGAAPEPTPPAQPKRDDWFLAHAYPMPPNFTGRLAEREMLSEWLKKDGPHPLLVLRALGGFGKSALVWHWLLHDVDPASWPRVVWWSFYEGDASFENFLASTVQYLSVKQIKARSFSAHEQLETLFQELHQSGTLLVLDGFERALRAFGGLNAAYQGDDASGSEANERDCISPLADLFLRNVAALPGIRAKVLLTTRLTPRAVEAKGGGLLQGAREEELTQMDPADAVAFFRVQGIRGTHTEIEQACQPYGYHPLSLRLLAGLIVNDFQQPGDIAAAQRLNVSGDLVQCQHHVLEAAFDSLTPPRQALLGRIACFRSPVRYDALEVLAETPGGRAALDSDLRDLIGRGLLHHDTREGRFDLHPIVHRYAYDRLTAPDRAAAHTRLRDYFAAVPVPDKVTRLEDLAPVIELYHHTVRAGQYDEACELFYSRITEATQYQLGAHQLRIDLLRALFPDGEESPPQLGHMKAQACILSELANSYGFAGQPRRALPLYEQSKGIYEWLADICPIDMTFFPYSDYDRLKTSYCDIATNLGNLALMAQLPVGALRAAEANLQRSIDLFHEIDYKLSEALIRLELGQLLGYRGEWADSEVEMARALPVFKAEPGAHSVQVQSMFWANRALLAMLSIRSRSDSPRGAGESPLELARRALELTDETARTLYPHERDYVRAHWLLGAGHRLAGQYDEAEHHLHEALERCRRINLVDQEANILIDLARLRAATGAADEAARLAEEALVIAERSGYILQGADACLELAKLALARGDKTNARQHATEARCRATCDGPPNYTYKVAYDEAGDLLDQLK